MNVLISIIYREGGNLSLSRSRSLAKDVFVFSFQELENSHRAAPGRSVDIFITADEFGE